MTQTTTLSPSVAHARGLLTLGLPLIGSNLAQVALHVSNTVMLGWYDVRALAAVALGTSLYIVLFLMGSGFAWAVMPMVAQAAASGDETAIRRVTRMGMWLSILYGIAILPLLLRSGPILLFLGQTPEVAGLGEVYLRIVGLALIPALLVVVLRSYLAALERTRVVLLVTLAALGLNILLNWALIFGHWGAPELGVAGAAVSSLTVQAVSVLLLGLYAARLPALRPHRLFQRFWRPDWPAFRRVFALGAPIGLANLAEAGLFSAAAVLMGWIGTTALAAHGIAMELASLAFMVHVGLSNAATVRTAQLLGHHDWPELRRAAMTALLLSGGFALAVVASFLIWPEPLVSLFLAPGETQRAAVIATGVSLLAAAALFQMGDAAQVMALGLLRGLQDTRVPMVIAAVSYWFVGVPASYLLGFPAGLGPHGIWFGLAIGLFLAAALLMLRFWRRALAS